MSERGARERRGRLDLQATISLYEIGDALSRPNVKVVEGVRSRLEVYLD